MEQRINLSEASLSIDIKDLTREIVHDLFLVCRKAGVYSIDHPMVRKALTRPFLGFRRISGLKKYFCLYASEGHLYANNILMTDPCVTGYLMEKMHEFDIESIMFDDVMTADDFEQFVRRFSCRIPASNPDFRLEKFLERRKVTSILVNHELARKLFSTGLRYREDVAEDFSVRRIVGNYFSGDLDLAVTLLCAHFDTTGRQAEVTGIDYHTAIVNYIFPEKFTQLAPSELLDVAEQILSHNPGQDEAALDRMTLLSKSFDYHPKRDELLEKIKEMFIARGVDEKEVERSIIRAGSGKMETAQTIDRICRLVFSDQFSPEMPEQFDDAFMRLVRTRQMGKAASITEELIERLGSETAAFRQRAIILLRMAVKAALELNEHDFLDVFARQLQTVFTRGRETFEFSEVVVHVVKTMLSLRRYKPVAAFLNVIKTGRREENGVIVYDSMTMKKIFEDLDDREMISRMVREMEQPDNDQVRYIRDILIAIQSEEIALQLAAIVVHPRREVRKHCLKVLSELGRPAVIIFSDIIRDEKNFQRPSGGYELPDETWYLVRNAIFVLGNLGNPAACQALRLRLSDPDIRVRLEITSALEKIGGDEAVDLLMIMADDIDLKIREAAVIALGLTGREDLVPFYIDLASHQKGEIARIFTAIAQTGSEDGRKYLTELLEDQDRLKALVSGKASVNDLKGWITKALSRMNDGRSVPEQEKFEDKTIPKSLFSGENKLGQTARLLLNRINPKK